MIVLLIVTAICIFAVNFWNLITLRQIKRKIHESPELNDAKYYELKFKSEFLIVTFSVIVTTAGLIGYNSINDIKKDITQTINYKIYKKYDSVLSNFDKQLRISDSTYKKSKYNLDEISKSLPGIEEVVKKQSDEVIKTSEKINILNSKNILKQNYYIVKLKLKKDLSTDKYYFQDLKTTNGDNLPEFTNSPVVLPANEGPYITKVINITRKSFEVLCNETADGIDTMLYFNVIIFENAYNNH